MKRYSLLSLAAAALLSIPSLASAAMLGSDRLGNLFSVNLATGASSPIGIMPQGVATEIEYDALTGILYAEDTNGGTDLWSVNPNTAAPLGSVAHISGALNGLEFIGPTLYGTFIPGSNTPSTLVTVNTGTGILTSIGLTGFGPVSGLAYDTASAVMYGVTAGNAPSNLISINLATGAGTLIGAIIDTATGAALDRVGSIEFGANGQLYGGISRSASINPNFLISINPGSGGASFIGNTGFAITGLTNATVPEPATLALLGAGLAGLGFSRRRKNA